jgi:hypothetical protein
MSKKGALHPKLILAFKDKEAVYTELESPLSHSFASWFAIKNDMDFVVEAFKLIIEIVKNDDFANSENKSEYLIVDGNNRNITHIQKTALYRAGIVTYAKAFTSSKGRKQVLNEKIFEKEEFKRTHKELYDERNTYHAHAGISFNETLLPIIAFENGNKNINQLSVISFNTIFKNKSKLQDYISIAEFARKYAATKAMECGNKLYKDEVRQNIDTLYQTAKSQN